MPPHSLQATGAFTGTGQTFGPFDCSQYVSGLLFVYGTYSGVNLIFESSLDGSNWGPVNVALYGSTSTLASSSGTTPAANASQPYQLAIGAWNYFRVRSSAYTSGTMNLQLAFDANPTPFTNVSLGNSAFTIPSPSSTSGGVSTTHHLVSAATTNATSVKASAGSIGHVVVSNTSAAPKYLKLFNKASAPTVGTDTPVLTILVPATGTVVFDPANYYRMTTGIAYAITGAAADADATAVAAGDVIVNIAYV